MLMFKELEKCLVNILTMVTACLFPISQVSIGSFRPGTKGSKIVDGSISKNLLQFSIVCGDLYLEASVWWDLEGFAWMEFDDHPLAMELSLITTRKPQCSLSNDDWSDLVEEFESLITEDEVIQKLFKDIC